MPTNRLRLCTAQPRLPAKTGTRIPRVLLIYLQTHERRHMRYSLLGMIFASKGTQKDSKGRDTSV